MLLLLKSNIFPLKNFSCCFYHPSKTDRLQLTYFADLPQITVFAGADPLHFLKNPAEVSRFPYPAGKSDLFDLLIRKTEHLFGVGNPHHLQIRYQSYPVLLLEQPGQVMLIDEEAIGYRFLNCTCN